MIRFDVYADAAVYATLAADALHRRRLLVYVSERHTPLRLISSPPAQRLCHMLPRYVMPMHATPLLLRAAQQVCCSLRYVDAAAILFILMQRALLPIFRYCCRC